MNCPKCKALMDQVTIDSEEVDRCSGCGGLWFDLLEHERLAASTEDVLRVDTGDPILGKQMNVQRDITCPKCHVKMLKMSAPRQLHIKFESCPVCYGAFFDAGELKDFATHTISERISGFVRSIQSKRTDISEVKRSETR